MLVEVEESKVIVEEKAFAGAKPFVVVGIPAYNEESSIARVVLEAQKYADMVVVCDDGSSDLTAQIARRLGADVLCHERNLGYGAAIRSLFDRACELGADVLVTLDADGQHDPSEIPNVLRPIADGRADVVVGSRFAKEQGSKEMPFYRRVGVKVITKMVNGSAKNSNVTDAQSGFRAYSSRALESLSMLEDGMGASVEILLNASKHGLKVCEVSSSCRYDDRDSVETSTENPVKHGVGVVMSIVKLIVEEKPLTLLGIPGALCLAIGAVFGAWMLQIYALEHHVVTNIALASMAFIMIGFFALSTAITLYGIKRAIGKIRA